MLYVVCTSPCLFKLVARVSDLHPKPSTFTVNSHSAASQSQRGALTITTSLILLRLGYHREMACTRASFALPNDSKPGFITVTIS